MSNRTSCEQLTGQDSSYCKAEFCDNCALEFTKIAEGHLIARHCHGQVSENFQYVTRMSGPNQGVRLVDLSEDQYHSDASTLVVSCEEPLQPGFSRFYRTRFLDIHTEEDRHNLAANFRKMVAPPSQGSQLRLRPMLSSLAHQTPDVQGATLEKLIQTCQRTGEVLRLWLSSSEATPYCEQLQHSDSSSMYKEVVQRAQRTQNADLRLSAQRAWDTFLHRHTPPLHQYAQAMASLTQTIAARNGVKALHSSGMSALAAVNRDSIPADVPVDVAPAVAKEPEPQHSSTARYNLATGAPVAQGCAECKVKDVLGYRVRGMGGQECELCLDCFTMRRLAAARTDTAPQRAASFESTAETAGSAGEKKSDGDDVPAKALDPAADPSKTASAAPMETSKAQTIPTPSVEPAKAPETPSVTGPPAQPVTNTQVPPVNAPVVGPVQTPIVRPTPAPAAQPFRTATSQSKTTQELPPLPIPHSQTRAESTQPPQLRDVLKKCEASKIAQRAASRALNRAAAPTLSFPRLSRFQDWRHDPDALFKRCSYLSFGSDSLEFTSTLEDVRRPAFEYKVVILQGNSALLLNTGRETWNTKELAPRIQWRCRDSRRGRKACPAYRPTKPGSTVAPGEMFVVHWHTSSEESSSISIRLEHWLLSCYRGDEFVLESNPHHRVEEAEMLEHGRLIEGILSDEVSKRYAMKTYSSWVQRRISWSEEHTFLLSARCDYNASAFPQQTKARGDDGQKTACGSRRSHAGTVDPASSYLAAVRQYFCPDRRRSVECERPSNEAVVEDRRKMSEAPLPPAKKQTSREKLIAACNKAMETQNAAKNSKSQHGQADGLSDQVRAFKDQATEAEESEELASGAEVNNVLKGLFEQLMRDASTPEKAQKQFPKIKVKLSGKVKTFWDQDFTPQQTERPLPEASVSEEVNKFWDQDFTPQQTERPLPKAAVSEEVKKFWDQFPPHQTVQPLPEAAVSEKVKKFWDQEFTPKQTVQPLPVAAVSEEVNKFWDQEFTPKQTERPLPEAAVSEKVNKFWDQEFTPQRAERPLPKAAVSEEVKKFWDQEFTPHQSIQPLPVAAVSEEVNKFWDQEFTPQQTERPLPVAAVSAEVNKFWDQDVTPAQAERPLPQDDKVTDEEKNFWDQQSPAKENVWQDGEVTDDARKSREQETVVEDPPPYEEQSPQVEQSTEEEEVAQQEQTEEKQAKEDKAPEEEAHAEGAPEEEQASPEEPPQEDEAALSSEHDQEEGTCRQVDGVQESSTSQEPQMSQEESTTDAAPIDAEDPSLDEYIEVQEEGDSDDSWDEGEDSDYESWYEGSEDDEPWDDGSEDDDDASWDEESEDDDDAFSDADFDLLDGEESA